MKKMLDEYCPIIEDTRSSAVNVITANAPFNTLIEGQLIVLVTKFATYGSSTLPTLNLTLSNGETTGGKPLYYHRNGNQYQIGFSNFQMPAGTYLAVYRQGAWYTDWNTVYYDSITINSLENLSNTASLITGKLLRDNFYIKSEIDNMIGNIETLLQTI